MTEAKEIRETSCSIHIPLSRFPGWLRCNDCETAWFDGFEEGVDMPEYSCEEDCKTDEPWCAQWLWDSQTDEIEIVKDDIDEIGLEGCVYWAAKGYGNSCSSEIAELIIAQEEAAEEEAMA